MDKKSPSVVWFFPLMVLTLLVWGGLLALGAYLGPDFWTDRPAAEAPAAAEPDDDAPAQALVRPFDYRKPLIVVAMLVLFLGGWGLALRSRQRRLARASAEAAEAAEARRAATAQSHPPRH